MIEDDDLKQIREIIKEEINRLDIVNYINTEFENAELKKDISNVKHDVDEYNKIMNIHSIEFRLKLIEKIILNIDKVNKVILKLIIALFGISIILLVSFVLIRFVL